MFSDTNNNNKKIKLGGAACAFTVIIDLLSHRAPGGTPKR